MSGEYKPGDVAMLDFGYGKRRRGVRTRSSWMCDDGKVIGDSFTPVVRLLTVIDPENPAQVERLAGLLWGEGWDQISKSMRERWTAEARNAVLAYTEPDPVPAEPEPTGVGAVAQTADGALWVRDPDDDDPRVWMLLGPESAQPAGAQWHRDWSDLDSPTVLFPGVQP